MSVLFYTFAPLTTCLIECSLRKNIYECHIGGARSISLPSRQDPGTGLRRVAAAKFVLNCELDTNVVPTPRFTWIKDGITVLGNVNLSKHIKNVTLLSDQFYDLNDNSLLLLFHPRSPIYIDQNFRVVADFSSGSWNVDSTLMSFADGTTLDDLKSLIQGAIAGNWSCTSNNAFGSDTKSSIVTRK